MVANQSLAETVSNSMDGSGPRYLELARQGDQEAFGHLVRSHARATFQLCFRITRDAALAEDAAQEAFYNAWRALADFDGRAAFSTWLHRIAANAALEQLRRSGRHCRERTGYPVETDDPKDGDFLAALADGAPGPEEHASGQQIGQRIARHMHQLSASERAAFVMRHCEGESLEAIAATLSMNVGQCKQAIFRAVRKLRGALGLMSTRRGLPSA
jgi:RNA polymerase sigma-70 factor (ECF subfamily)